MKHRTKTRIGKNLAILFLLGVMSPLLGSLGIQAHQSFGSSLVNAWTRSPQWETDAYCGPIASNLVCAEWFFPNGESIACCLVDDGELENKTPDDCLLQITANRDDTD